MAIIKTEDSKVGMKVKEDVVSNAGQIIIHKGSILNHQMISHLKYYYIHQLDICDDGLTHEVGENISNRKNVPITQLEQILKSEEFELFKKDYKVNVSMLEKSINDLVMRNSSIDAPALIEYTVELFQKNQEYFSFFGMLHATKQIDDSTFAHSINVAMIARLIGIWSGMSEEVLDNLTLAGLLHDLGKSRIPDEILMKPKKLTPQEYKFMQLHPEFGYELLKNQDIPVLVKQSVLHHHERCDGSGYPFGLDIHELDEFSCIISIADVYDAMTSDRCYRSGLCPFEVISFFEESLQQYHPKYITTFLHKIAHSYMNCNVLLSNGDTAKIVYLGNRLTRPLVQLTKDFSILDLERNPDIYIQAII